MTEAPSAATLRPPQTTRNVSAAAIPSLRSPASAAHKAPARPAGPLRGPEPPTLGTPETILGRFLAGDGRAAGAVAIVLALGLMLVVSLVPIRSDNDCWWHVRTGELLLAEFAAGRFLPTHDLLSFTAEDYEWHNHEWLAQAGMALAFKAGDASGFGGWRGVILLKSMVLCAWIAVVLFLARRLSRNWWIALLVAVLAIAIGRRTYYPRPPVLSNLLIAWLLVVLVFVQNGWWDRKWLWTIPPLFAVWTNLHGAWLAGGVILGAYAAGDMLAQAKRIPSPFEAPPAPAPWRMWILVGAATLLATLANPYGWRLYELPARVLTDRELVASIGELQPPVLQFTRIFLGFVFAVLAAGLLTRRFRPRFGELAIFLFFLFQGLEHVRHLLLFAVAMVPMAARLAGTLREEVADALDARSAGTMALATGIAVWGLTLVNYPFVRTDPYPPRFAAFWTNTRGYEAHRFPAALCDFVELARLEGRMFNENHYAGYIIWRLSPHQHRVFSDPRFDIFGGDIWRQEDIVATGFEPADPRFESWRDVLDRWDIQWAIQRPGTGGHARMAAPDSGWASVALFDFRVTTRPMEVFVRDTPDNAAMIERARRAYASAFAPPR